MATDTDNLFELRNYFFLGNYQATINEANSVNVRSERDKVERDTLLYRCYIAQGNYQIVIDEIEDSSASAGLQAVKLLATYLSSEKNRDIVLVTLKQWLSDGVSAGNQTLQVVAGTIYYQEQSFEEVLKCLHQSNSLEGLALLVQTYLKMDRVDLAEKELKAMQQMDEDSTVTQLATAWVYIFLGGEKFQEAFFIFKELSDKYGSTVMLLNGQAICNVHLKKFEEAEHLLLEALEKNSKDADTIINLVTCYLHLKKPAELVARHINQLKSNAPNHPWAQALKLADESFERTRSRYAI